MNHDYVSNVSRTIHAVNYAIITASPLVIDILGEAGFSRD